MQWVETKDSPVSSSFPPFPLQTFEHLVKGTLEAELADWLMHEYESTKRKGG